MKLYEYAVGDPDRLTVRAVGKKQGKPVAFRKSHTPTYGWGADDRSNTCIVLAVLDDALGDEARALRLMMRFKHRMLPNWKPDLPWSISDAEVLNVVRTIESVESETAMSRRMVAQEPAPIASDRGADIQWTKEPKLVSNIGRKP